MVFQYSTLLGCMSFVPVVSTIQILIFSRGIPSHLVRPSEEWLVLNPIYDLVHWLLERHVYLPYLHFRLLDPQVLSGSRRKNSRPDQFTNSALPLLYNRSSSSHLYSSIRLMSCLISLGGLFVNDSQSSEFSGSPILKVLAAILSLPPPISL